MYIENYNVYIPICQMKHIFCVVLVPVLIIFVHFVRRYRYEVVFYDLSCTGRVVALDLVQPGNFK